MSDTGKKFEHLQQIIVRLRRPDGCPWDRKQTPETFKSYIIEEVHELLEAVDQEDPGLIRDELGDMLFQLTFLGNLYEEQGHFSMADSLDAIAEKMVRRHPHVFGDEKVRSEAEQRKKWNEIKAAEAKKKKKAAELLAGVPKSLPALRRAQRVSERAAHNGFEWPNCESILDKIREEVAELEEAAGHNDQEGLQEEIGDLLFALVNLGRLSRINTEEALQGATEKFISRFSCLEKKVHEQGKDIRHTETDELLALWREVKKELT